jgi:hypothetical protein
MVGSATSHGTGVFDFPGAMRSRRPVVVPTQLFAADVAVTVGFLEDRIESFRFVSHHFPLAHSTLIVNSSVQYVKRK